MTNRASITDLPNPFGTIAELESELLRVRAANDVFRHNNMILTAELATATAARDALERMSGARESLEVWRELQEARADRDALRARAEQAEAALSWWEADSVAGHAMEYYSGLEKDNAALRARLQAVPEAAGPVAVLYVCDKCGAIAFTDKFPCLSCETPMVRREYVPLRAAVPDAGGALTWHPRSKTGLLGGLFKKVVSGHYTMPKCDLCVPMEGGAVRVVKGVDENVADEIVRAVSVYNDIDFVIADAVKEKLVAAQRAAPLPEAVVDAARDALEFLDALRGEGVGVTLTMGERELYQTVSERLRAALPPAPAENGE